MLQICINKKCTKGEKGQRKFFSMEGRASNQLTCSPECAVQHKKAERERLKRLQPTGRYI